MHRTLEFLLHHGYVVLPSWVFAEQMGLPLPSMPLLLAAGALSGTGNLNFLAELIPNRIGGDGCHNQIGERGKKVQVARTGKSPCSEQERHRRERKSHLLGKDPAGQDNIAMMEKEFECAVHGLAGVLRSL